MVSTNDVDGVKVTVDLEASDSLAVRLKSIRAEGPARPAGSTALREQAQTIVSEVNYLDGELALIEVDGVSNAALIRSRKPSTEKETVRFAEVVLRDGNLITVEAKGAAIHVSQENLEKLTGTLVKLTR